MADVDSSQDIIDSRDVIERIEELQDIVEDGKPDDDGVVIVDDVDVTGEYNELNVLQELQNEGEQDLEDWEHGCALIRDSYFQTYAEEFADDIGAIDGNARWPLTCIDWEQAARELKQDYQQVDFDGVTYWAR